MVGCLHIQGFPLLLFARKEGGTLLVLGRAQWYLSATRLSLRYVCCDPALHCQGYLKNSFCDMLWLAFLLLRAEMLDAVYDEIRARPRPLLWVCRVNYRA